MNEELIAKAKEAKSVEELLSLAKENNYPLTEEEARNCYDRFHASGELSDDELDQVGGGCGGGEEEEKGWTYHESTKLGCFDYERAPEYEGLKQKLTEVCYYCKYQEAASVMSYSDIIHCHCKKGNTPMQRY